MKQTGKPASPRVAELFEQWVERQVLDGVAPDPEELCRGSPELVAELRECIRDYQFLERALTPPQDPDLTPAAAPAVVGETVSHYRIVERLGEGGMGVVYRAEDVRLGRIAALKFLPRELTGDATARDRFLREAQAASSLDHPHICTIYEVDETEDGQLFIAMACYDGETLRERLERGPLSLREGLVVALQILEGLAAVHALGVVHRDLKPANVLLTDVGGVKILDFGLAKLTGSPDLTRTGVIVGTCAYMSPEQIRGDEVDRRSDLWGVGVVLYEMLAGRLPFHAGRREVALHSILHEQPQPLRGSRADVPEALERIVSRSLAKDPGARYQDADEMLADLRRLRAALDVDPTRVEPLGPLPPRRRPKWLAAAIAAPLVLAAGLGVVVWRQAPRPPPAETLATDESRLLFDKARDYEGRGDLAGHLQTAEGLYRKALALEPENPALKAHLAALLARIQAQDPAAGRADDIRRLADEALAADTRLAPAWVAQGRLSMLAGDYPAAEQAARRAVASEPGNHLGYSLLGQALVAQGRSDEGISQLQRGVEVGRGQIDSRLALARELIRVERLDQAAIEYQEVLKYDPENPNALGNLAAIYGRTGRDLEAIPLLRRALAVQPSYRDANNLGAALFYLGRYAEAIGAFRQAYDLDPERPAPLVGLGDSYARLGDEATARRWLRLAMERYDLGLEAGGPRAQLLGSRAVCAAKLGDFEQARVDVAEALALEPATSRLLFAAAQVHAFAGDREATYEYVERALAAGYPRAEFHRDTAFSALQDDPRFRALLES